MIKKALFIVLFCLNSSITLSQPEELVFDGTASIIRMHKVDNILYYTVDDIGVNYIDLTDPSFTPQTLINTFDIPVGMEYKDEFLYVADWGAAKVVKLDLTQSNPSPIDVTLPGQKPNDLMFIGDILYYSANTANRIMKYDINLGTQIPELLFAVQGAPIGIEYKDGYLYIASPLGDTIYRKDLSDEYSELEVVIDDTTQLDLDHPINIEFAGNELFIASRNANKILKVDISNPPYIAEEVLTLNGVKDLLIDDGVLYYCNTAFIYRVELSSLSVDDFFIQKTRLFPNPAKNEITISNLKGLKEYEIYDTLGRLIKQGITNSNEKINVTDLRNGFYLFRIIETDVSIKFMKN